MNRHRLLLVDDDELSSSVMQIILDEEGYDIHLAYDGAEAREKIRKTEFDLIILDQKLPDTQGTVLAYEIKAVNPEMKLFLLTGFGSDLDGGLEAFEKILTKPVSPQEMVRLIREALS